MFRSYLKSTWRNITRDKQFSILNLLGLSTGLACAFMIYLWVNDEINVDKFNSNDNRLFAVLKTTPNGDGTIGMYGVTQGLLANAMAKDLPEVEYAVAVREERTTIISVPGKILKVKPQFVDKDFFKLFSYKIIDGDISNILNSKNTFLISDKLALKLFNTTKDIVGRRVDCSNNPTINGTYAISGVFAAPPSNASEQFDFLMNMDFFAAATAGGMGDISNWGSNMMKTYVLLKPGTDPVAFNAKIKDFTKTKIKSLYPNDKVALKYEGNLFIQRFSERYLHNRFENGVQSGGRISYVQLFSMIALFIVVIACINFMNLSTAKASRRMKETGIKKVVGASRSSLIIQYMSESILMSLLALLVATVFVILLLPAFREFTGKQITIDLSNGTIITALGITLITGLIAGSYPALYLSGFKPLNVLKGKSNASVGESRIRKCLVVFQFTISAILIITVLVVYKQMQLIQTTNLGFSKENIIRFSIDGELLKTESFFLSELKSTPGIINAAGSNGDFVGNVGHGGGGIRWEGKDPNLGLEYYGVGAGYGFFETMNLQMAEGRWFSPTFADSNSVVFNETAIRQMGINNPIGKKVSLWGKQKEIVGIVKDYHYESMYKPIGPAFIEFTRSPETIIAKIKPGNEAATIQRVQNLYAKYNPGLPFEYRFIDDDYQQLYASEQRVSVLSRYFAGIAILISCLGLFGLAAFTAQKRQKEIGIRKVIGASVSDVVMMLSSDFLKLVLIAIVIAFPLAWLFMHQWLQAFAYRINIGTTIFLVAALTIVLITLLTISFQAIKAAIVNPVKSLRTE